MKAFRGGWWLLWALCSGAQSAWAAECVQVYYDPGSRSSADSYGRLTAIFLQNLLGHFPHLDQYVLAIDTYQPGQLERCKASLYVGTYYGQYIPETFFHDWEVTTKNVAWLGYNIWEMGPDRLHRVFGARYSGITGLDWQNKSPDGVPGFYRYFDYLGQRFEKYAEMDSHGGFNGAHELVVLRPEPDSPVETLATARHSTREEEVGYVFRNKNFFFVGDNPFSFMTEDDRYLIFSDVLFDILGEKPVRPKKKLALVRLEDVHARIPGTQLAQWEALFNRHQLNHAISLIPYFKDPTGLVEKDPRYRNVPLDQAPELVAWLKKNPQTRSLLLHGYTHQSDNYLNPMGPSGMDFEFWDNTGKRPLAGDSVPFVLNRLESALTLLDRTGVKISAWLTPHYAASPLDHTLFGQMFLWNVGRTRYESVEKTQNQSLPSLLSAEVGGAQANGQRLAYFSDLVVRPVGAYSGGQFFPYEISGDYYGQRLIPESIGFVEPGKVSVDVLIRRARRNLVLRDAWASFFVHPFLMSSRQDGGIGTFEGDSRELDRLFTEVKNLGYEFVDLKTWVRRNLQPIRKPPVETLMVELTP